MTAAISQNTLDVRLAQTTNPLENEIDPNAIEDLLSLMRNNKDTIATVLRFLGHKIQSPQELEALKALRVLETLVQRGDRKFIEEMGKNRFLNELIKVISPKYLGQRSPDKVKQKIIELLYLWSIELKQEPKIFEAYQMLKRQGLVAQDPVYIVPHIKPLSPPAPRPKDEIWDNEENAQTLRRLIHSGNPQDLIVANKLIKALALHAERKSVTKNKCINEIELARNNARLLSEVLANYDKAHSQPSELELIHELRESCEQLRSKIFRTAGKVNDKDPLLNEMLCVSDEMSKVLNDCKLKLSESSSAISDTEQTSNLLNVNSFSLPSSHMSSSQLPAINNDVALLCDYGLCHPTKTSDGKESRGGDSYDCSGLIDFLEVNNGCTSSSSSSQNTNDSGQESSVSPSNHSQSTLNAVSNSVATDSFFKSLLRNDSCLDELENQMRMKLNVAPRVQDNYNISLNAMKNQFSGSNRVSQSLFNSSSHNQCTTLQPSRTFTNSLLESEVLEDEPDEHQIHQSLTEIFVPLESIEPSDRLPVVLVDEKGLKSVINFGKNRPKEDVTVAVLTTTNSSSHDISKIFFHLKPPQFVKTKLQAPSSTSLAPSSPFLPPSAITQVILLSRKSNSPSTSNKAVGFKLDYTIKFENFSKTGEFLF